MIFHRARLKQNNVDILLCAISLHRVTFTKFLDVIIDDTTNLFHDGVELSDAKEIATAFNSYFATIGEKLAASIHENNNVSDDFQQYLDTPAETKLKLIASLKMRQ